MSRAALLHVVAVVAGFYAGFLWGARTRDALAANTSTSFDSSTGTFTVSVKTFDALTAGLHDAFGGLTSSGAP